MPETDVIPIRSGRFRTTRFPGVTGGQFDPVTGNIIPIAPGTSNPNPSFGAPLEEEEPEQQTTLRNVSIPSAGGFNTSETADPGGPPEGPPDTGTISDAQADALNLNPFSSLFEIAFKTGLGKNNFGPWGPTDKVVDPWDRIADLFNNTVTNPKFDPSVDGPGLDTGFTGPDPDTDFVGANYTGFGGFGDEGVGPGTSPSFGTEAAAADAQTSDEEGNPEGGGGTGPGGSQGTGGGEEGDLGSSFAHGGMVTPDRLTGPDPAGPDDGYAALDRGEFVLRQDAAAELGPEALSVLNSSPEARQAVLAALRAFIATGPSNPGFPARPLQAEFGVPAPGGAAPGSPSPLRSVSFQR